MIIRCHGCQQKYSVRDDKMRGRSARIRCRVCGESLIVSGDDIQERTSDTSRVAVNGGAIDLGAVDLGKTAPMLDNTSPMLGSTSPQLGESTPPQLGESTAPMQDVSGMFPQAFPQEHERDSDAGPSTGARNSTSVLFSLAALAHRERQEIVRAAIDAPLTSLPSSPSLPDTDAGEDSGVIDLHRLMPSGSKLSIASVKPPAHSEPPLAVARDVQGVSSRPKRVLLFVAVGVALMMAFVLGSKVVLDWAEAQRATRAVAVQDPAAPMAPVVASMPMDDSLVGLVPPPPEAAPAASSEANVSKAIKSKSRKHRHSRGGSRRSGKTATAETAPAPAPNDPCQCSGDLACAMRCASSK